MPKLFLPPGVRYTCIRCGDCCRSLEVTMSDAEHERLLAHDWWGQLPDYAPERFFARIRRPRGKQAWRLRPLPGGPCRFLGDDNLCRVHATLGLAAKPFAGRLFPFTFLVTPVGVFVGCRFNCPAVVRGKGPELEEQRRHIKRLFEEYARIYNPPREPERVRFFGRYELSWGDILKLEDQLLAFLLMRDLDLARRLLCCRRLVRGVVAQAIRGKDASRVGVEPDAVVALVRNPDLERRRLSLMERMMMRLLAATFLGATLPWYRELSLFGRASTRVGNLRRSFKLAIGRGRVLLPGMTGKVPVREIGSPDRLSPDAASEAMLERYFVAKIASQGFFGGAFFGRSFVEGMDFLAVAYGTILWLGSAHAAAFGHKRLQADDVEYGIRQVDYAFNYLRLFGGVIERLRGLFFWHWETPEKVLAALSGGRE